MQHDEINQEIGYIYSKIAHIGNKIEKLKGCTFGEFKSHNPPTFIGKPNQITDEEK